MSTPNRHTFCNYLKQTLLAVGNVITVIEAASFFAFVFLKVKAVLRFKFCFAFMLFKIDCPVHHALVILK